MNRASPSRPASIQYLPRAGRTFRDRLFGIHALVFAAAVAFGIAPHTARASALDQFKSFVATTQSAKGEFVQRLMKQTKSADGKSTKLVPFSTSSGTFEFSRPGKFIWTYTKPYDQVLQADGERLYIYDKELNQVTTRKLGSALGSSPAAILFGSNDLEKNFDLKEAGSKDGLQWLKATPKAKDTTFDSIGIGMRDGMPASMELRDSFGQLSVLSFTRFQKNPPLPANAFKFVIPKGADVLQQ